MSHTDATKDRMGHLRAWREQLGLTRPEVVHMMSESHPDGRQFDQATLAKWESGEAAVKLKDLINLATVYDVQPILLLQPPGRRADALKRAVKVISRGNVEAVERWLEAGENAAGIPRHINGKSPRGRSRRRRE